MSKNECGKLKKGLYYCGEDHLANGKEEAGKAKVTSWRNGRKAKYLKGMAFNTQEDLCRHFSVSSSILFCF